MQQNRDTGDIGQHFLGLDHPRAVPHLYPSRQARRAILVRVVGGDEHSSHTLEEQDARHRRHVGRTRGVLPASHCDDPVHQDLVGDVDTGRNRPTHRELAAVRVRAVAEVLNQVRSVDERCHADPLRAFVTHAREANDVADPLGFHHRNH